MEDRKKRGNYRLVHEYIYQRAKSNQVDFISKNSFVLLVNLYEEKKIFSEDNNLIEYQSKDVRDVYLDYPINNIPEQYQFLLELDDVINDTFILDIEEFKRLADEEITDEYTLITYRLPNIVAM